MIIFMIRRATWSWNIVPILFQTHKHSQTHTDMKTYPPFLLPIVGIFLDLIKSIAWLLCWLQPCVCPPCNSFCQTTGMAIVSKSRFSVPFEFKSETERGDGLFLLAVCKILCGMLHPYNWMLHSSQMEVWTCSVMKKCLSIRWKMKIADNKHHIMSFRDKETC